MLRLNHTTPVEVLYIEDNPGDVDLVKATLRKSAIRTNLTWARDGVDGLTLLREKHLCPPLPDLILLDWNLPKKCGADVLREIKQSVSSRRIPVIVLTSSSSPEDVALAYDLGANCYLSKSVDLVETRRVLQILENFWFTCVRYAPPPRQEVARSIGQPPSPRLMAETR